MSSAAFGEDPATSGRRQALVLLAWWLAITGLVLLVGAALTGPFDDEVTPADNDVNAWFAGRRTAPLTEAAEDISLASDTFVALGLTCGLLLVLWFWLRHVRPVLFLAAAALGGLATYLLTVNLVPRPRPAVPRFDAGLDPQHSYPSGHVAAAMATYGGLAVILWVLRRHHRRVLTPLLFVPAVLIALSRVYLGVHHPTDVMVSLLFMSAWLGRCAAVLLEPGPT